MNQIIKQLGTRAVVITEQGNSVSARLYVNVKDGFENSSATPMTWNGKTVTGAQKWADKQLNP